MQEVNPNPVNHEELSNPPMDPINQVDPTLENYMKTHPECDMKCSIVDMEWDPRPEQSRMEITLNIKCFPKITTEKAVVLFDYNAVFKELQEACQELLNPEFKEVVFDDTIGFSNDVFDRSHKSEHKIICELDDRKELIKEIMGKKPNFLFLPNTTQIKIIDAISILLNISKETVFEKMVTQMLQDKFEEMKESVRELH
jgi:hypothetical protein